MKPRIIIVAIICLLLSPGIGFGQSGKNNYRLFKPGTLVLPNTEPQKGHIWLANNLDGDPYIHFRKNPADIPIRYNANEVISFSLNNGVRNIVSLAVIDEDRYERVFVELIFKGKYKLYSALKTKEVSFYLMDNSGGIFPLENTFSPFSNDLDNPERYNYEYRQSLSNAFNNDPIAQDLIAQLTYSQASLVNFLMKYHKLNDMEFTNYSKPYLRAAISLKTGVSVFTELSDIQPEETVTSPMMSLGLNLELSSIAFPLTLSGGLVFYKGLIVEDAETKIDFNSTGYYEDIEDLTILGIEIMAGISILNKKKFSIPVNAGIEFLQFSKYKRTLSEEIMFEAENIVVTNLYDNFEKPDNLISAKIGITPQYQISRSARIGLVCSYNYILTPDPLLKSYSGISANYKYKF